jgi:hypothetical protein
VVRPLLAFALVLGSACAAAGPQPCAIDDHSKVFAPDRKALAPTTFDAVRLDMTMSEIIELLGPAHRELGSGLMIFGWESTDGRIFLVGGPSMCERPIYARFDQGVPSNKSLERTRGR